MRRRLVVLLALLMGCVLAALSVPFGRSIAAARAQEVFLDRLHDTNRFASAAAQASTSRDVEALRDELHRYGELYGITAAVVGRGGTTWAVAGSLSDLDRPEVVQRVKLAIAGHPTTAPDASWPWSREPVVVAVPVMRGDTVIAVAVTVSPSTRLRAAVGKELTLLVLADLAAMALLLGLAVRLANWVLRPVSVLDAAARRISEGDLSTRVGGATGPIELRQLSTTFNGMAQAVDLAMQRQEAFVADASHQLRNPLAALVLRLDALAPGVDDAHREQLQFAREEATRLTAILDELLELATAVQVTAAAVTLDVNELVAQRLQAWQPIAFTHHVRLVDEVTTNPPAHAYVDPVLVSSALDAVLDNAVKFTPAGGAVTTSTTHSREYVDITIEDTGPGLDAEDLTHVGARFWRSAASQNVPGSGLGLSIARTLLATTGASISFATAHPHGLRVTIRLPTTRPADPSPASPRQPAVRTPAGRPS